ncbi:MAG TPA: hypothetical protein VLT59_07935, partial [Steroidobacteraceae bacterium]|nr:hypothetical protein [Steroidobacteraceae bacterium]
MTRSTAVISGHPWGQYAAVLLALAVGLAGLSNAVHRRPIDHPAGALVSSEPQQSPISDPNDMRFGQYTLRSRAEFVLEARLLASKKYRFDPGAGLAPYDFALGWGPMADSAVLSDLDI